MGWNAKRYVVLATSMLASASPAAAQRFTRDDVSRLMAEAPQLREVELAPDGAWVVYTVARGSVASNQYVTDLMLLRLDPASGAARGAPSLLVRRPRGDAGGTFTPRRCPDGKCLTFFVSVGDSGAAGGQAGLVRYNLAAARASVIAVRDTASAAAPNDRPGGVGRPRITRVATNYRWSPSGSYLAFTAPVKGNPLDPRRGVNVGADWRGFGGAQSGLFVLDLRSSVVTQVTPDSFHVAGFDWSPDDRALAFAATPDPYGVPTFRTDLFVVDRGSGAVRSLVRRTGLDAAPHWSPDGRWIAFSSHFGEQTYYGGWPAVVPSGGGEVVRIAGRDDPKLSPSATVFWHPDARTFYYPSTVRMTQMFIRADRTGGTVAQVERDEMPFDDHFSVSADGRWLAFTRESLTSPPELFVRPLPNGEMRQLTQLAAAFPLRSVARVDTLSWPSRDRKFRIHGMLLTPASAWNASGQLTAPMPTLVFLNGGPSMVRRGFAQDGNNGAQLPMASLGYAVLVPNTRGRGGYGEDFQRGMRDGPSAGRLPYEDMMEGVDVLVRRGIADSTRLGVYGHSYGGYLTSYVVTQTSRFRGAVNHEGHVAFWVVGASSSTASPDFALLARDLYGFRNMFDPAERARVDAESPGMHADKVRTPMLLTYAAEDGGPDVGRPLFNGLQKFGIPSELVVYDEGHVFNRPAAVADNLARTAAWMDYWVRDLPYPDAARQREYDEWKRRSRAVQ